MQQEKKQNSIKQGFWSVRIKFLTAPPACDSSWAQRCDPLRSQPDQGEPCRHAASTGHTLCPPPRPQTPPSGCLNEAQAQGSDREGWNLLMCTTRTHTRSADWLFREPVGKLGGLKGAPVGMVLTTWSNFRTSTNLRGEIKETFQSHFLSLHWWKKFGFT